MPPDWSIRRTGFRGEGLAELLAELDDPAALRIGRRRVSGEEELSELLKKNGDRAARGGRLSGGSGMRRGEQTAICTLSLLRRATRGRVTSGGPRCPRQAEQDARVLGC